LSLFVSVGIYLGTLQLISLYHVAVLSLFLSVGIYLGTLQLISLYHVAVLSLFVSVGIYLGTLQLISTKTHTHCCTQGFVKAFRLTGRKIMFCIAISTFHFPGFFQLFEKRNEGRLCLLKRRT